MAFQADFFTLTKKRNSTLVPSGTGSFSLSVTLNDGNTSLLSPSIRVVIPSDAILQCNYCHITKFNRYYYIDDWIYNADGTWTANCSVDELASWRTAIKASSGYVDRAYTEGYVDGDIIDTLYPAKTSYVVRKTTMTTGFNPAPSGGTFLIAVLSSVNPSVGPLSYYYMDSFQFGVLVSSMLSVSNPSWSSITTVDSDVLKAIINPMQYITRVMWLPFVHSVQMADAIKLGGWDTGASGHKTTDIMFRFRSQSAVSIPQPTGFKAYPPYSKYTFVSPVFGTFELDGTIIAKNPSINWEINVNAITGSATLVVTTPVTAAGSTTNYELFRSSTQLGVEIPMAQISTNYSGIARGAASAVNSAINAVTNPVGAVAGIASGVLDAVTASMAPNVQSSGSINGGFNIDAQEMWVESIHYSTVLPAPTEFGYPIKAYLSLSNYSGYVKLVHSDFSGACTSTEKDAIIGYLEGGAFLE